MMNMSNKKPSIKDVAEMVGVSYATVSNVFTGKKKVNEDLQRRVREAAAKLGYFVDKNASQLRTGNKSLVAVLVPNIADSFFAEIVSRIEKNAIEAGYDIVVASTHGRADVEESRLAALMSWRPAGLIVVPTTGQPPLILNQPGFSVPTVLLDRVLSKGTSFDTVTLDNEAAGYQAGIALKDAGHTRISVVASDLSFPPIAARLRGFVEGSAVELGDLNIVEIGDDMSEQADLYPLIFNGFEPTAVFALNYTTTLKCLTTFSDAKLMIGKDVSFVAFDDYSWMSARITGVTAIKQPVEEMADAAWKQLMFRLESEVTSDEPQSVILPSTLIERDSVISVNESKTICA